MFDHKNDVVLEKKCFVFLQTLIKAIFDHHII